MAGGVMGGRHADDVGQALDRLSRRLSESARLGAAVDQLMTHLDALQRALLECDAQYDGRSPRAPLDAAAIEPLITAQRRVWTHAVRMREALGRLDVLDATPYQHAALRHPASAEGWLAALPSPLAEAARNGSERTGDEKAEVREGRSRAVVGAGTTMRARDDAENACQSILTDAHGASLGAGHATGTRGSGEGDTDDEKLERARSERDRAARAALALQRARAADAASAERAHAEHRRLLRTERRASAACARLLGLELEATEAELDELRRGRAAAALEARDVAQAACQAAARTREGRLRAQLEHERERADAAELALAEARRAPGRAEVLGSGCGGALSERLCRSELRALRARGAFSRWAIGALARRARVARAGTASAVTPELRPPLARALEAVARGAEEVLAAQVAAAEAADAHAQAAAGAVGALEDGVLARAWLCGREGDASLAQAGTETAAAYGGGMPTLWRPAAGVHARPAVHASACAQALVALWRRACARLCARLQVSERRGPTGPTKRAAEQGTHQQAHAAHARPPSPAEPEGGAGIEAVVDELKACLEATQALCAAQQAAAGAAAAAIAGEQLQSAAHALVGAAVALGGPPLVELLPDAVDAHGRAGKAGGRGYSRAAAARELEHSLEHGGGDC